MEAQLYYPCLLFDDLNGDGKTEILMGMKEDYNDALDGRVYCFAQDGRILWSAKPGRQIRFGDQQFEDRFLIIEMMIVKNTSLIPAALANLGCRVSRILGFRHIFLAKPY